MRVPRFSLEYHDFSKLKTWAHEIWAPNSRHKGVWEEPNRGRENWQVLGYNEDQLWDRRKQSNLTQMTCVSTKSTKLGAPFLLSWGEMIALKFPQMIQGIKCKPLIKHMLLQNSCLSYHASSLLIVVQWQQKLSKQLVNFTKRKISCIHDSTTYLEVISSYIDSPYST